jgi:hypothetical protein
MIMRRLESFIAALIACVLVSSTSVMAQSGRDTTVSQPIRDSIARYDFGNGVLTKEPLSAAQTSSGRQRSVGRKIAGGAIGGVGGFFAGGYLGAAIDGDCGGCDDPGFLGFLIGAPIGAVVGAILGVKFF